MKKRTITMFALLLISVFCLGLFCGLTEGFWNWNTDAWFGTREKAEVKIQGLKVVPEEANNMRITARNAGFDEEGYTKSVTLEATIYPEEVANKAADWRIAWEYRKSDDRNGLRDGNTRFGRRSDGDGHL